jgi:hypothetical protein
MTASATAFPVRGIATLQQSYTQATADPQITVVAGDPLIIRSTGFTQSGANPVFATQNNTPATIFATAFDGTRSIVSFGAFDADLGPQGTPSMRFVSTTSIGLMPVDRTFTATSNKIAVEGTYTASFTNAVFGSWFYLGGTHILNNASAANNVFRGFDAEYILRNAAGVAANMGATITFNARQTLRATSASYTATIYTSFGAIPTFTTTGGGTVTVTTLSNFNSNGVVGSGATITAFNGMLIQDPSGAGTVTTLNGINIENLTKGGTNKALTIAQAAGTAIEVTGAGAVTISGAGAFNISGSSAITLGGASATFRIFNGTASGKGTLTGSRALPEQALKNLITMLAGWGFFTDSTTV